MRGLSLVPKIGLLAAVVGAANWLVVGIWHYNFVADIFGSGTQSATTGARIVYIIFGAGAIISLPLLTAGLGRLRMGRRSTAESEHDEQKRQQLVDYQEFKEFQAWRAVKQGQEGATGTERGDQRAA